MSPSRAPTVARPAGVAGFPVPVPQPPPVAYWKFNNDGSSMLTDSSPGGHTLTFRYGTASPVSDALFGTVLDGTAGTGTALTFHVPNAHLGGYSIEYWSKLSSLPSNQAAVGDWNVQGVMVLGNSYDLSGYHDNAGAPFPVTATPVLLTGSWQYHLWTWNGQQDDLDGSAPDSLKLYVGTYGLANFALVATGDAAGGPGVAISQDGLRISGYGGDDHSERRWPGLIAHVAIYDYARTAAHGLNNYNHGADGPAYDAIALA